MGMIAFLGSDDGEMVELDKSWHGIHYLLTGTAEPVEGPEGFMLSGGTPDEDEDDVGYGPMRHFTPEEARTIAELMAGIEPAERFDADGMDAAGVYPGVWGRDDEEFEYLEGYFFEVLAFMQNAVRAGLGFSVGLA